MTTLSPTQTVQELNLCSLSARFCCVVCGCTDAIARNAGDTTVLPKVLNGFQKVLLSTIQTFGIQFESFFGKVKAPLRMQRTLELLTEKVQETIETRVGEAYPTESRDVFSMKITQKIFKIFQDVILQELSESPDKKLVEKQLFQQYTIVSNDHVMLAMVQKECTLRSLTCPVLLYDIFGFNSIAYQLQIATLVDSGLTLDGRQKLSMGILGLEFNINDILPEHQEKLLDTLYLIGKRNFTAMVTGKVSPKQQAGTLINLEQIQGVIGTKYDEKYSLFFRMFREGSTLQDIRSRMQKLLEKGMASSSPKDDKREVLRNKYTLRLFQGPMDAAITSFFECVEMMRNLFRDKTLKEIEDILNNDSSVLNCWEAEQAALLKDEEEAQSTLLQKRKDAGKARVERLKVVDQEARDFSSEEETSPTTMEVENKTNKGAAVACSSDDEGSRELCTVVSHNKRSPVSVSAEKEVQSTLLQKRKGAAVACSSDDEDSREVFTVVSRHKRRPAPVSSDDEIAERVLIRGTLRVAARVWEWRDRRTPDAVRSCGGRYACLDDNEAMKARAKHMLAKACALFNNKYLKNKYVFPCRYCKGDSGGGDKATLAGSGVLTEMHFGGKIYHGVAYFGFDREVLYHAFFEDHDTGKHTVQHILLPRLFEQFELGVSEEGEKDTSVVTTTGRTFYMTEDRKLILHEDVDLAFHFLPLRV